MSGTSVPGPMNEENDKSSLKISQRQRRYWG